MMSRRAARRRATMRKATDLPVPGSPATSAKPPSWTSCSTRQAKWSMAGVTSRASPGNSGENGFHFKPHRDNSFLLCMVMVSFLRVGGGLGQVGGRQSGGGVVGEDLLEQRRQRLGARAF